MSPREPTRDVRRILAYVTLSAPRGASFPPDLLRQRLGQERFERFMRSLENPDRLDLAVRLSAELASGERISTERPEIGLGLRRRGLAAIYHRYRGPPIPAGRDETEYLQETYRVGLPDIEDAINHMLGRDPELHRPPRLAWENLIAALSAAGVSVTEEQLIALPLSVELDAEVEATLRAA